MTGATPNLRLPSQPQKSATAAWPVLITRIGLALDGNKPEFIMVALCNRADHYIFAL